jgi:hypothetical protein
MKGILTYNRIINLITVYFYNKDWMEQTTDYIKEKYDRIFYCLPDKIKIIDDRIIYPKTISNYFISNFYDNLSKYQTIWYYNKSQPTKDEIIMLFTVVYISTGGNLNLNPIQLQKRYSCLFTTFDYINEDSQINGLHELIRLAINESVSIRSDIFLPYIRNSKILKIKNGI